MNLRVLLTTLLLSSTLLAEDLVTVGGKKYTGITVTRTEPDGITISHDDGSAKIAFTELPADLQKKYGYDPQKAADYSTATIKAKQDAAERARVAAIEAKLPTYKMEAKIIQISEGGALVRASVQNAQGMLPLPDIVFVFGIGDPHVDGEVWDGIVYLAGTYRYTTTQNAAKSVRAFSTNREDALRRIRSSINIK